MEDAFSGLITLVLGLLMSFLNIGAPPSIKEQNLATRFRRSAIDSYSPSCPTNYYCLSRLQCSQSDLSNPAISLTSCQSADYPSSDYVCCPVRTESSPSSATPSLSALKFAKMMSDKMLKAMLDQNKQNSNNQGKSQSTSDIIDDSFLDEIMTSLDSMKNKQIN